MANIPLKTVTQLESGIDFKLLEASLTEEDTPTLVVLPHSFCFPIEIATHLTDENKIS